MVVSMFVSYSVVNVATRVVTNGLIGCLGSVPCGPLVFPWRWLHKAASCLLASSEVTCFIRVGLTIAARLTLFTCSSSIFCRLAG